MSSDAVHTDMTGASGDIATVATPTSLQDAIPRLPNHLVVAHVLRSEYFDDPADLARLPAVSRAMRDAMAATGLRFEELVDYRAVNIGCLSAVERLQRGGRLSRQEYLCHAAARGGNLEKLKEFRANGCPWNVDTCSLAADGGHLEVLQWARANGCLWSELTCACAAIGGHLEVLQWLRANGCPWDAETCDRAAEGGHLEVLQWARANGCLWSEETCAEAAGGGHLEVLQWLRTNGCPWDKWTCMMAAYNGHLEVLQWARANGCRWTASTREKSAHLGYINNDGSPCDKSSDEDSFSDESDDNEPSE